MIPKILWTQQVVEVSKFDVQNNEFTIFIILFVILSADDTIILSDDAKEVQETLSAFNEYCKR